jgi:putative flippase GtrA
MIRHFFSVQFLLFIAVGLTAALSNWGSRYVLGQRLGYSLAVFLAYAVGIGVAFLLNRLFVFPASPRPLSSQACEFLQVNIAFMPLVWLVALALRHLLREIGLADIADGLAHAIALALPGFSTFLIYKFSTFAKEGPGHADK